MATTTDRRRRERSDARVAVLDDAFSYARALAGDPPDWDTTTARCTVGPERTSWSWVVGSRAYRVHQYVDGSTSVEVVLS